MRLLPAGSAALLAEVGTLAESRALHAALATELEHDRLPGVLDVVPAARTVLVTLDPRVTTTTAVAAALRSAAGTLGRPTGSATSRTHEISVVYDGADLAVVAEACNTSVEAVVERHARTTWQVAFAGFAPGFAYLAGDGWLQVPRRSSPRTAVPAGSVALADTWCGIYPRTSPGGWQLVGHTDARLWDIDRQPPGLLVPGDTVRFVPVDRLPSPPEEVAPAPGSDTRQPTTRRAVEVIETGPLATLQDLGRPGYAELGLGRSGAADRTSHALALRLTGCAEDAATVEVTLGGFAARARDDLLVAVTGATSAVTIDGRPEALSSVVRWPRGSVLRIGRPTHGLRSYLAVAGGWQDESVLGSRAYDTLSGTGPAPLCPGDVVGAGDAAGSSRLVVDQAATGPADSRRLTTDPAVLTVEPGPRADWFTDDALRTLTSAEWSVTADVDRVGVRLQGPTLARAVTDELPSEGVVRGSVQVSSDGQPTLFLSDHPVTGGYPVIAVLSEESCDRASQLVPGARVRLSRAGAPAARRAPR